MGFWANLNRGLSYLTHGEDMTYEGQRRSDVLKQLEAADKDRERRSIENGGQGLNNYELHQRSEYERNKRQ